MTLIGAFVKDNGILMAIYYTALFIALFCFVFVWPIVTACNTFG